MPDLDEYMFDFALPDTRCSEDNEEDVDYIPTKKSPRLTDSMHPHYIKKFALGKAWEAQKKQKFGKDNLLPCFLPHTVIPV
jgi:hypothetical protein